MTNGVSLNNVLAKIRQAISNIQGQNTERTRTQEEITKDLSIFPELNKETLSINDSEDALLQGFSNYTNTMIAKMLLAENQENTGYDLLDDKTGEPCKDMNVWMEAYENEMNKQITAEMNGECYTPCIKPICNSDGTIIEFDYNSDGVSYDEEGEKLYQHYEHTIYFTGPDNTFSGYDVIYEAGCEDYGNVKAIVDYSNDKPYSAKFYNYSTGLAEESHECVKDFGEDYNALELNAGNCYTYDFDKEEWRR